MKNLSLLTIIILLFSSNLYSQDNREEKTSNVVHSVGAAAGFTTGYGLAYRATKDKLSLQVVFSPMKSDYESTYSTGITFMYVIDKRKYTDLFLYQANHYFYHSSEYGYDQKRIKSQINTGLGLGMDFRIVDPFSFNLMLGYASFDSFNKLGLSIEMSLFYVLQ